MVSHDGLLGELTHCVKQEVEKAFAINARSTTAVGSPFLEPGLWAIMDQLFRFDPQTDIVDHINRYMGTCTQTHVLCTNTPR